MPYHYYKLFWGDRDEHGNYPLRNFNPKYPHLYFDLLQTSKKHMFVINKMTNFYSVYDETD